MQAVNSGHLADDCVLLNDIDASESRTANPISGYPGEYYGFVPIGSNDSGAFTGTFDGGGFTISNLYINRGQTAFTPVDHEYIGLFGLVSPADETKFIKDLTLKDFEFSGKSITGGLAANVTGVFSTPNYSTIENCHVRGTITQNGSSVVGGFIGDNINNQAVIFGKIADCTSSVSIAASAGARVGGFIARTKASEITNCVSGGTIILTGAAGGGTYAGGFCNDGNAYYASNSNCIDCRASVSIVISDGVYTGTNYVGGFYGGTLDNGIDATTCYAAGTISVLASGTFNIGGFCGEGYNSTCVQCAANVTINAPNATVLHAGGFSGEQMICTDCYSIGDVCLTGISDVDASIGGFVGESQGWTYTNCYSIGKIDTSSANAGGFAGKGYATGFTRCHFDTETSGTSTGVGDGVGSSGVMGQTTAEMKLEATYTSWDFNAIWDIPTYTQPAVSQSNLTVWLSKVGDYERFDAGVNDDEAFDVVVPSTNEIMWVETQESLVIGTAGDEWIITSNKLNTPLSPQNHGVKNQSSFGSANIQAIRIGDVILYIDFVKRKVREMTFTADKEKFVSPDLSSLAEHITETGIVDIAHQKNPDSILWCVLTDGSLIGMVYDREQNVVAWFDCPMDGTVLSVCVTPGTDEDDVWVSVQRTINGATKLYVEKMGPRSQQTLANSFFVDSGVTTSVSASDTITGADHLEGEKVAVLADGAVIYDGTEDESEVSSGNITLPASATYSVVQYGLPYTAVLQPMRIVQNSPQGTTLMENTRISELKISFLNTLGAKYGASESNLFSVNFSDERLEDEAHVTGLFSGDVLVVMPGGFSRQNPILIVSDQPLPMTCRAIVASFEEVGR